MFMILYECTFSGSVEIGVNMKLVCYSSTLLEYGGDILASKGMKREKKLIQHGTCSVYQHSLSVAAMCLNIADTFHIKVSRRAMVRGALLHDYFLYDWHEPVLKNRIHGFTHPYIALKNAQKDFELGVIEKNMIKRHMFPLVPIPPKYREGVILCIADKICALSETITGISQKSDQRRQQKCRNF